jgi:hypothetical protein
MLLALAGLGLARRQPALALLGAPDVRRKLGRRRPTPRGRLLAALELPGEAVVDLAEVVTMLAGSARYRTLVI